MTGTPANLDRLLHAWQARVTRGVSPTSLTVAFLDWAVHLAGSPGAQQRLADKAVGKAGRLAAYVVERWRDPAVPACIEPLPQDHRFDDPAWRQWPFDTVVQAFLLSQQWWHNLSPENSLVRYPSMPCRPSCRTCVCTPSGTASVARGCRSPPRRWPGTGTSGWPV